MPSGTEITPMRSIGQRSPQTEPMDALRTAVSAAGATDPDLHCDPKDFAAQRRKNWPRWVLAAALVLSVISLVQVVGDNGVELDSGIEIVSCLLTAAGLYFSFTGDAQGWFNT